MKKIIVLSNKMAMGGTEIALLALLKKLVCENYDITLLLLKADGPTFNRIPVGVKIKEINISNSDIYERIAGKDIDDRPFCIIKRIIAKAIKTLIPQNEQKPFLYDWLLNKASELQDQYDVVLDFYGYGNFMTAFGAKRISAHKRATWFHDENIGRFWGNGKVNKYLNNYDILYCVSDAVKNSLDRTYPEFQKKTRVLLNFIDRNEIVSKSNENIEIPNFKGDFIILTVGRLVEQKGIDIAIKSAVILKQKGIDFQWYVIGDGLLKNELEKMIDKENVSDRFHLLGRIDNPFPYIRNCSVFVQPSRHEGYSVTIIEAKTLCKPIIVSNIPSNCEQIEDGRNGLVADLNPESFASKIVFLYSNERIRESFCEELALNQTDFLRDYDEFKAFIEEA